MRPCVLGLVVAVAAAVASCTKFGEDPRVELGAKQAPLVCRPPPLRPGNARTRAAFPNLKFEDPTRIVRDAAGSRWYVAERNGVIKVFEDREDVASASVFWDLAGAGLIHQNNEYDGLLGLTLHPRFAETGEIFVTYTGPTETATGAAFEYRIDRARSTDGGKTIDPSTRELVLAIPRQSSSHHGGPLLFGNDGMLYASTGDGYFGDPNGDAQRMSVMLGKILRLDVGAKRPYAVPADNPFVSTGGARPEIWALGFRNPYGMWLDRQKGDLWVGDVGHLRFEEIDLVTRGGNYGWKEREGFSCFSSLTCKTDGFIDPLYAYSHADGFCVTAGFVYRGSAFPALREAFVFGDEVSGRISTLRDGKAAVLVESGTFPVHITESRTGEIYLLDYGTGTIQEIVPDDRVAVIPKTLSETGCFDPKDGRPASTLFPYDVNMPLWSDGADKQRWLHLPGDGKLIKVDVVTGKWDLPVGSAVFKTFIVANRKVETRMLVNHEEGGWAGYTYAWNEAQDDATLLETGETRDLSDDGGAGRTWTYPSRSDCFACHNLASGRTLGLTSAQMNRNGQIEALDERGVLDLNVLDVLKPPLSDGRATDTIEGRARAYLEVNCSNCHRQSGPAAGLGDLQVSLDLAKMNVCNVPVENGEAGSVRLKPGDPAGSAIIQRMRAEDGMRMPPLASHVVDERGAAWVAEWIASLPADTCPPNGFQISR